jgi:hypothetical protein
VLDAILGINFLKENNVVINLTEGHFMARRDGFDCECKVFFDTLPKNGVGVGFVSDPEIQLNLPDLQRYSYEKDEIVGMQTTIVLMLVELQGQKKSVNKCDKTELNELAVLQDKARLLFSRMEVLRTRQFQTKNSVKLDNHIEFMMNMLCNNEDSLGEQDTVSENCEIGSDFQTRETAGSRF